MMNLEPVANAGHVLTMRGEGRVTAIRSCVAETVTATFHNWQIYRLVTRDFYFTCQKMFFKSVECGPQRVVGLLAEVTREALLLASSTQRLPTPQIAAKPVDVKLMTAESKVLLDAFIMVDQALLRMLHSPSYADAINACAPFLSRFGDLKEYLQKERSL